jgi:hypothetical protein
MSGWFDGQMGLSNSKFECRNSKQAREGNTKLEYRNSKQARITRTRNLKRASRLKRAERLQNELFDYLLAREVERSMDAFLDDMNAKDLKRMHESVETDPAYAVGRMIARDYRGAKTLDRMTLHERRLEGSLYRTMRELDRVQSGQETYSAKRSQSPDDVPAQPVETQDVASPDPLAVNSPSSAKQTQLDGAVSSLKCEVSSGAGRVEEDNPSCETKPIASAGGSVKAEGLGDGGWANHRQAALDDATQEGTSDSAKQSQSPDDVPAQPVETQDFASPQSLGANDPGSAKQSQLQEQVSGLKCEVSSGPGPAEEDNPPCETKPIASAGGSVKAEGLGDGGWANHRQAALDDATQEGTSDSAKQSQSPDDVPAQPVETQYFASPDPLAVNSPSSAKQSQLGRRFQV